MRSHVRVSLLTLVVCIAAGAFVPVSSLAAEAPGIEKLAAVNCSEGHEQCAHKVVKINLGETFGEQNYSVTEEPGKAEAEAEGYVQAAGHVPFGVTDFTITHTGSLPVEKPTAVVQHIRTDVAPGLAASPTAVPFCSAAQFGKESIPGSHLYPAPTCPEGAEETKIGIQQATVYVPAAGVDLALEGNVYNLEPPTGRASLYGVSVKLPKAISGGGLKAGFEKAEAEGAKPGVGGFPNAGEQKFLEEQQYYAHTLIEGNVEWGQEAKGTGAGDYHDYFEIEVSPTLQLVASRLVFYGRRGGHFITNGTSCPGHVTTRLAVEDLEKATVTRPYTSPLGLAGCENVPFEPGFLVIPATTQQDQPDGFTAEATLARHNGAAEIDASELKTATFALPEGMTLNPAAAAGLTACTVGQARIHSAEAGMACPASSELGTVQLDVPTLPTGSLTGKIYLGSGSESSTITSTQPITIYLDAESTRYGVSVRLRGEAFPSEATGQLTTVFPENPEQPFTNATLHFKQGALAPVANPLACGTVAAATLFTPYSGQANKTPASNPFTFDLNGAGGACPATIPLAPTQKTSNQSNVPAAHTSFTFSLERPDGQQYFSSVSTTLPAGLVGLIPTVTQCGEPQAAQGTCSAASRLGTATVQAGSGPTPFTFTGPVYLTGPYNGAPFGLSIAVPAVAGPFSLGTDVVRAAINVNQSSARVVVSSTIPRVYKGVTLRLKKITVAVDRQGFLINPTNCGVLSTETSVTGFIQPGSNVGSATALTSSPFQLSNCGSLAFKPSFKAVTSSRFSKVNGASLETTINQPPGQANIKSVLVSLPKQLPSRLSTLQKACTEATFAANPYSCPAASVVGSARANTPTLPSKLTGPAILVSHGGAAFPDLDLVLAANGVKVILVGNTDIKNGITTTHFAATPDVPVSSITVNLPTGPHSALAGFGNFCTVPLYMPTTIEGQNGKVIKQKTKLKVNGCGVKIVGRKVVGHTVYLTIRTFAAGRISASGSGVSKVYRHVRGPVGAVSLKVQVRKGHRRIRVGFLPDRRALGTSVAYVTVSVR